MQAGRGSGAGEDAVGDLRAGGGVVVDVDGRGAAVGAVAADGDGVGGDVVLRGDLDVVGDLLRERVDGVAGGDPAAVSNYGVSFAGVLFPGETLRVRAWETDAGLVATASAVERDEAPVLGNVVLGLRR